MPLPPPSPILVQTLIPFVRSSWIGSLLFSVTVAAAVFLPGVSAIAMLSIWAERRLAARIQSRLGPNRVGPLGLLQSIADGVKLLLKEDLQPADADRFLFQLAPYLVFVPMFAAFLVLPFGPNLTFEPRLNVGVFWLLASVGVEVVGVILAGWASNNKWSVYGAMREACQMISYEVPLGLSIIIAVMAAGTLNLVQLGHLQGGGLHTWIICRNPVVLGAYAICFIASLASNKRAPFDLPESESELVAGYHTEYSGLRFSFFFFAEYAGMFLVAGVQTALFLGGWNDPFGLIGFYYHRLTADPVHLNVVALLGLNAIAAGVFVSKCAAIVLVQMWIRWTLPRPRIDQVLYACVKVLLPMVCVLLLAAAVWQLFLPEMPGLPWRDYNPWKPADFAAAGAGGAWGVQMGLALLLLSGFAAIVGWIAYAFATRGNVMQRRFEAELIPLRVHHGAGATVGAAR
jgi:NADH-quinone oxidoreductase subunit H